MEQSRLDDYLAPLSWSSTATEGGTAALNDEQKRVLEMVIKDGKNVFFTGAAGVSFAHVLAPNVAHVRIRSHRWPGTGKSLLLRAIIDTGCTVPFL